MVVPTGRGGRLRLLLRLLGVVAGTPATSTTAGKTAGRVMGLMRCWGIIPTTTLIPHYYVGITLLGKIGYQLNNN